MQVICRAGTWVLMIKSTKMDKKLPPNSQELKESYDIFDGGG